MSIPADSARSLSAPKIAQGAGRLAWAHRADLLRLALVPALGSFALNLVALGASGGLQVAAADRVPVPALLQIVLAAGDVLLGTLFAVGWLRVLLLQGERGQPGLGLRWRQRHWLFLGRSLVLAFGCSLGVILAAALTTGLGALGAGAGGMTPAAAFAFVMIALVAGYLFLRFWLVLPAAAVDHPYGFARAWRDSAGASVPTMLATLLLALVLTLVGVVFVALADGLYAEAPLSVLLLASALNCAFAAVLLAALAIVFRRSAGWRDPAETPVALPANDA